MKGFVPGTDDGEIEEDLVRYLLALLFKGILAKRRVMKKKREDKTLKSQRNTTVGLYVSCASA